MNDSVPLIWAAGLFEGEGCIYELTRPMPSLKRMWMWRTGREAEVDRLLNNILLPYLGNRRRQKAEQALEWLAAKNPDKRRKQ